MLLFLSKRSLFPPRLTLGWSCDQEYMAEEMAYDFYTYAASVTAPFIQPLCNVARAQLVNNEIGR